MNRPIEFRAWDTVNKIISPVGGIDFDSEGQKHKALIYQPVETSNGIDWDFDCVDSVILMQYTGLTDESGKKIFEGDVVRVLYTDWPSQTPEKNGRYKMSLEEYKKSISDIGEVIYNAPCFCVEFCGGDASGGLFPGTHGEIEVIGNIYQNPELLTSELENDSENNET